MILVDARGMIAAFALGAQGVQLGTRFIMVEENMASPLYKQAILMAKDTDTVITCRKLLPTRSLRTEFSKRLLELDESSMERAPLVGEDNGPIYREELGLSDKELTRLSTAKVI